MREIVFSIAFSSLQFSISLRFPEVNISGTYVFELASGVDAMAYITTGAFTPGSCATGTFVIGDDDFMKFDESAKLLEVFIKNGIAVASVNYRLSQEALFPAAGVDTKSAIRFLRANASKYGYDPKKFATGGDSAGSYLALMAGITGDQSSIFDDPKDPNSKTSASVSAVIDLYGNADFFEMTANNARYPVTNNESCFVF